MFDGFLLKEKMRERGFNTKCLAAFLGIDSATLYRKLRGDFEFTGSEIGNIMSCLKLSDDELKKIFF